MKILVTGSEGLVGRELGRQLKERGHEVVPFDTALAGRLDVTQQEWFAAYVDDEEVEGVVHLAACSRVVWGEQMPGVCINTNVRGTWNAVHACSVAHRKPWLLFASSREVYGECGLQPVREEYARRPLNTYGMTKCLGEDLVLHARKTDGLRTAVVRLSSVYGSTLDHHDRLVPAFARAAGQGGKIYLHGVEKTYDLVHVEDAARGLAKVCDILGAGDDKLMPIHLTTGEGTEITKLARWAKAFAERKGRTVEIERAGFRGYDVTMFVGDPMRASAHIGWKAQISAADGFGRLADEYSRL